MPPIINHLYLARVLIFRRIPRKYTKNRQLFQFLIQCTLKCVCDFHVGFQDFFVLFGGIFDILYHDCQECDISVMYASDHISCFYNLISYKQSWSIECLGGN